MPQLLPCGIVKARLNRTLKVLATQVIKKVHCYVPGRDRNQRGKKKKAPQNKTHTQKEVGNMVRTEKRGEMKKYSNTRHPLA